MNKIEKAKMLAEFLHNGQKYGDGEDYIVHLDEVYRVLLEFLVTDITLLVCAWLHDIIEDTAAEYKLLNKYFGVEVADIVFNVTNESGTTRKDRNIKTYAKIATDVKSVVLKLADRIANVRRSKNNANRKFYEMYKKEYVFFRYYLYMEETRNSQYFGTSIKAMWEELDTLMEYD